MDSSTLLLECQTLDEWARQELGPYHWTTSTFQHQFGSTPETFEKEQVSRWLSTSSEQCEHWFGSFPLAMVFSQSLYCGKCLAVGGGDGQVQVLRVFPSSTPGMDTSQTLYDKISHSTSVCDLKFQPPSLWGKEDGDTCLYSTSCDSTVTKHDLERECIEWNLIAHTHWVKQLAFDPQDRRIFWTCGSGGTIRCWDERCLFARAMEIQAYENIDGVQESNSRPENVKVEISRGLQPIVDWTNTHQRFKERVSNKLFFSPASSVTGLSFISRDPMIMASCGASDGMIKLWDVRKVTSKKTRPLVEIAAVSKSDDIVKDPMSSIGTSKSTRFNANRKRGIQWMDCDQNMENLAIRTLPGIVLVYKCSNLISQMSNTTSLSDGDKYQPITLMNQYCKEKRTVEYIHRPALSGDGRFVAVQGEMGKHVLIFDLWKNKSTEISHEIQRSGTDNERLEALCLAWGKSKNSNQWAIGTKGGAIKIFKTGTGSKLFGPKEYTGESSLFGTNPNRRALMRHFQRNLWSRKFDIYDKNGFTSLSNIPSSDLQQFIDCETWFWEGCESDFKLCDTKFISWNKQNQYRSKLDMNENSGAGGASKLDLAVTLLNQPCTTEWMQTNDPEIWKEFSSYDPYDPMPHGDTESDTECINTQDHFNNRKLMRLASQQSLPSPTGADQFKNYSQQTGGWQLHNSFNELRPNLDFNSNPTRYARIDPFAGLSGSSSDSNEFNVLKRKRRMTILSQNDNFEVDSPNLSLLFGDNANSSPVAESSPYSFSTQRFFAEQSTPLLLPKDHTEIDQNLSPSESKDNFDLVAQPRLAKTTSNLPHSLDTLLCQLHSPLTSNLEEQHTPDCVPLTQSNNDIETKILKQAQEKSFQPVESNAGVECDIGGSRSHPVVTPNFDTYSESENISQASTYRRQVTKRRRSSSNSKKPLKQFTLDGWMHSQKKFLERDTSTKR